MLRFDRMLFGLRNSLAPSAPVAAPVTPLPCAPPVSAPGAVAPAAPPCSSTGASVVGVVEQPASAAAMIATKSKLRMPPPDWDSCVPDQKRALERMNIHDRGNGP